MEFIAHKLNTIEELKKVPREYGVEIDIRDYGKRLILQHDPFKDGEDFEEYLKHYNHGTMILNIKSERIEFRVLELLEKYRVNKYFFLDCSFPMIYLLSEQGERNIALRYSKYEGLDTINNMEQRIKWIWVDCFDGLPINRNVYEKLKNLNLKLCIVSPELQMYSKERVNNFIKALHKNKIYFDSVCTKYPDIWDT